MTNRIGFRLGTGTAAPLRILLLIAAAGCVRKPLPMSIEGSQSNAMQQMPQTEPAKPQGREIATVAGGCFWCTEAIFTELKGVDKVVSGYSGGHVANPTYRQVCSGGTGHAEAINITFDPSVLSYKDLLRIFFTTHDPTTLNRQGADEGTQYRSAIFYHNQEQRRDAGEVIKEIDAERIWPGKIVTEVTAFTNFYPAEDYHQDYFAQNSNQGYCQVVIAPKVAKFRAKYRDKLKR
jgi:peptide-methionine (S)-S-oxide reductase